MVLWSGSPPTSIRPISGRSLLPAARGEGDSGDEAIGECCAELTAFPVIMIRRVPYKYIYCAMDPPMLFDPKADPDELHNLAADPAPAKLSAAFAAEVRASWKSQHFRNEVIKSQRQRQAVQAAMEIGVITSRDYNPPWGYQSGICGQQYRVDCPGCPDLISPARGPGRTGLKAGPQFGSERELLIRDL